MQQSDARWVREAIAQLPQEYREVIILRELEDMSYKEISAIVNVPMGTVMSRLARGRDQLAALLDTGQRKAQPLFVPASNNDSMRGSTGSLIRQPRQKLKHTLPLARIALLFATSVTAYAKLCGLVHRVMRHRLR